MNFPASDLFSSPFQSSAMGETSVLSGSAAPLSQDTKGHSTTDRLYTHPQATTLGGIGDALKVQDTTAKRNNQFELFSKIMGKLKDLIKDMMQLGA